MMPRAISPRGYAPIFNWIPPPGRKLSLVSFIIASTVLHALCFYVFQIVYPPTIALLPPPARVSMITPSSEEGRVLLRWIEAEDPALSLTTLRPLDAGSMVPPKPPHQPSYLHRRAALKELTPFQHDLRVPSSRPPGPAPLPRQSSPSVAAEHVRTRITFSSELLSSGAPVVPAPQFNARSKEPPQSAQFRVAIGSAGEIRHCFVHISSGDGALDEQARRHLLLSRFSRPVSDTSESTGFLLWGTATIEWGNDVMVAGVAPALPSAP